jgi:hypothetical protein
MMIVMVMRLMSMCDSVDTYTLPEDCAAAVLRRTIGAPFAYQSKNSGDC